MVQNQKTQKSKETFHFIFHFSLNYMYPGTAVLFHVENVFWALAGAQHLHTYMNIMYNSQKINDKFFC